VGGVGFVFHESAYGHMPDPRHPEHPDRVRAINRTLEQDGLLDRLDRHSPSPAARDVLELVHSPALVDLLEHLDDQGGGRIDLDTSMGPGSLDATLRSTQGTIDAAERVLASEWSAAFVCMRPPGHHATPSRPMGFCLTNHVAVAARWANQHRKIERVLVLDWDAHHGNGTQEIFWEDGRVLYVSLHQYPWYPGTGDATEQGEGAGRGFTLNVPLPAGAAEDAYELAFDDLIEPVVAAFDPQLIFVSAGYDAHHRDPLCMMRLTSGSFFRFAQRVARWGPGPVCVLEGGYDLDAIGWSVSATLAALLGADRPDQIPPAELDRLPGTTEAARWVERAASLRNDLQDRP
jgi:acetoin utilization deacetylase AcuC-like enzyme